MSGMLQDALTVFFARGFVRIAQVFSFVLLARYLPVEEFGWFGLVTTAIALAATLGSLGLRQAVAYRIGRSQLSESEAIATIFSVWPILAAVSAAVVFLFYGGSLPKLTPLAAASAILVGVGANMLLIMLQGIFLGRGDISMFNLSESLPRVVLAISVLVLAFTAMVDIASALWVYSLSFASAAIVITWNMARTRGAFKPRCGQVLVLIKYGLAFAFNLFLLTLFYRANMYVVERYLGAAAAGVFFAAIRASEIALEAAAAFGLVVFSRATRANQSENCMNNTARAACWIFWCFSLIGIPLSVGAPWFLRLLLGEGYPGAGDLLRILALGLGAAASNKVIYPAIAGRGLPLFGLPAILTSLLINVALSVFFVPLHGVQGAALSLVISQYLMLIGYIVTCKVKFDVRWHVFIILDFNDLNRLLDNVNRRVKRL